MSSFANFALDPAVWLFFGETAWDESVAQGDDATLQCGWVEGVRENILTFQRIKRTNKRELRPRAEEVVEITLRELFPVIAATEADLKNVLKLCVCLKPSDETSMSLVQLCVFISREGVQSAWGRAGTLPCFGDLFRILSFFCLWVPQHEVSPLMPVMKTVLCKSEAHSLEQTLAWMAVRDNPSTSPVVFRGMPNAALFRIPDTPIVLDTRTHSIYDIDVLGQLPSIACPGGVLVGPPGSGKFTTCVGMVMKTKSPVVSEPSRPRSAGNLLLLPAEGLSWRYMQLRKLHPKATIVRLASKSDLLRTTWAQLLTADFVMATYQFLNTKLYADHMHHVLSSISHYPEKLLPETLSVRCTKRRRRVVVTDSDADDSEPIPELDCDLQSSKTSMMPRIEEEYLRFTCECTRRVLNKTAVRFENFTAPVLEVVAFRRVLFVDSDRQSMSMHHLKAFEGESLWTTATKHSAKNTCITLPHAVFVIPNATAKQYMVAREMTCVLRPDRSQRERTVVHTDLPMTLREALVKTKAFHFTPASYAHFLNVVFVAKNTMGDQVLAAARQQLDTWIVKRDILRTDIERATQDAAGQELAAAEVAEVAIEVGAFMLEYGDYEEDDDAEYNFLNDDDDEEEEDEVELEDEDDEDEEDEEDDDDDDDDDEFDDRLEEVLSELTPERMTVSMNNLTSKIEDFQRDETLLTGRIESTVREVIGKETCLICSNYTCNAMLPCAHAFCVECLLKWQESKKSCPACNTPGMKIIAAEECDELPCPMPDFVHIWTRVWNAQTLSSQMFWFMATLSQIADRGTKALILIKTAADGRALLHALRENEIPVRHFMGSASSRYDTLCKFRKKTVHIIVLVSDVLAGAGFGNGVTDVVFADPGVTPDEEALARFHTCKRVYTHARIRSPSSV